MLIDESSKRATNIKLKNAVLCDALRLVFQKTIREVHVETGTQTYP